MPLPDPNSRAFSAPIAIALASLLVAVLAFVAERTPGKPPPTGSSRARHVLFENSVGLPQIDLVVVTPAGADLLPDGRGILQLQEADAGPPFQVLEARSRRRLTTFTLAADAPGLQRVVVER